MNNKNRGRRGATLAELAIVIAVIAIVAVMVTSFIVMIDGSRDISQMKLEAMQDIVLTESVIENFINDAVNVDEKGNSGFTTYSSNKLIAKNGRQLHLSSGGFLTLVYAKEDNKPNVVLELETVKSISFDNLLAEDPTATDYLDKVNSADNIFYCTITYNVGGDSDLDYTFCVNPYAGENIKEVTP